MTRGRAPILLVTLAAALVLAPGAVAAEGSLDQLPGTAGCVTETGRSNPWDASTPASAPTGPL